VGRVGERLSESKGAKLNDGAVLGPVDGGIVHDIFFVGELNQDAKFDRFLCNSFGEFVE